MSYLREMKKYYWLLVAFGCLAQFPLYAQFGFGQKMGSLVDPALQEVSGLVVSHQNPGVFWVHNDSGNKALLFGLNNRSIVTHRIDLEGISLIDWEDCVLVKGKGGQSDALWIADIGDNKARRSEIYLHRILEPILTPSDTGIIRIPKSQIQTFTLTYEKGPRDAETLLYDPVKELFYLISKRELQVEVYEFQLPLDSNQPIVLQVKMKLPLTFITGGSISRDGTEVLIKNLLNVYYWKRREGESLLALFSRASTTLPYIPEAQGEALDFSPDGKGYYSLSERPLGLKSYLMYYPRN